MIQAILYTSGEKICGFDMAGHANYAPYGEDIVCAAVSVLAIATVNSLETQLGQIRANVSDETGRVSCFLQAVLDEQQEIIAQSIFQTLEIGLRSVEQTYPDYLKLRRTKIQRQRRCAHV